MSLILIGGVPRTGKTTLAQVVAQTQGHSWVSTDALEAVVHRYTPIHQQAACFPKADMRKKTNYNNDKFYQTYGTDEIVRAYRTQARTTENAIEALVRYAHKDGWDYVIEGYHVTPALQAKLKADSIPVTSLCLILSNPEKAIDRSRNSITKNDWIRDHTSEEKTFSCIADMLREYSTQLADEARHHNIHTVDMSNDFKATLAEAQRLLKP